VWRADVPLVLDGDELTLDSLLLDGMEIDASLYDATPDSLTIRGLPESAPFEITVTTTLSPETNTKLDGALPNRRGLLHPVRVRRLPPHHLFLRPARCSDGLHSHHHRRPRTTPNICCRTAISWAAAIMTKAGISPPGSTRTPSPPICSRWWRRSRAGRRHIHHHERPRGCAEDLCRARQGAARGLRNGRAQALDEMGRGDVWPGI
jgi:hypothetical protein